MAKTEGTGSAPYDDSDRRMLGLFDGINFVFVRGDATYGMDVDITRMAALVAGSAIIGKVKIENKAGSDEIDPLAEATFTGRLGEVQASPTANTVLARLKDLLTGIVIAAGTNLIGKVSQAPRTDVIYNGTTELTPIRAFANIAAGTTDGAVAGSSPGKKLRVLALFLLAGGTATEITFNSKGVGAGTAISCALANGANGGAVLPLNPLGWFETNASEGLTVTTGAGSTTGIQVVYVEV